MITALLRIIHQTLVGLVELTFLFALQAADDTKDDEEDAAENENESEEPDDKRATRANVSPRSTSTPTRGRGRGGAANRARRGRKTAKWERLHIIWMRSRKEART